MNAKRLWVVLALCVLVLLSVSVFTETANAQFNSDSNEEAAKSSDKKVSQRKGVEGSLADGGGLSDASGASKVQMALGIGSCVVAFIVVKYL